MESYLNLAYKLTKFLSFAELKSRLLAMGVIFDMNTRSKPRLKRLYLLNLRKPFRAAFIKNKLELDVKNQKDKSLYINAINFSSSKNRMRLSAKQLTRKKQSGQFQINIKKVQKRLAFNSPKLKVKQSLGKKGFKYYEICKYLGGSNFHKTISLGNSDVKLSLYHFSSALKKRDRIKLMKIPVSKNESALKRRLEDNDHENQAAFPTFFPGNLSATIIHGLKTGKYKTWCLMQKEGKLKKLVKSNISKIKQPKSFDLNPELVFSTLIVTIIIVILLLMQAKPV